MGEIDGNLNLEKRIAQCDRDAMASFLKQALSAENSDTELLRKFNLVRNADHGNDTMALRNLALVSALRGDGELAFAYGKDLLAESFYADAFHIALGLASYRDGENLSEAKQLLLSLSQKGHIRSQVVLKHFSVTDRGFISKTLFFLYRVFKVLQAMFMSVRNPRDPRVAM